MLTGQVILITGASSGIGAATARAAAQAGMDCVLNARRADRLDAVAADVRQLDRRAVTVVGDVTDHELSTRLLDAAEQEFGRFDVIFANAGYGIDRATHELTDDELRRIFEVNFFASHDLLRTAARRLLAANRRGHLLMCSSCVAKFTLPNFAAYSATKAAQNHFCRAMRMELRPRGIQVASVHPITTETEFFDEAARQSGQPGRKSAAQRAPRMFVQTPEQVAAAVIRCLRRPRPEVWTSFTMRFLAGLMTIFPRMMDLTARVR